MWPFTFLILEGKCFGGVCSLNFFSLHLRLCYTFINFLYTLLFCVFSLKGIAKHFRYGSQEDAHEFLRYTVDAMQKSCLPGTK